MYLNNKLLIAKTPDKDINLSLKMANRHGLITGATGTGKTVTAKVMIESLSAAGVPTFIADVKGDIAGTALIGQETNFIKKRIEEYNLTEYSYKAYPVHFFDIYGENGHPIRAKVSDVGYQILSIMLGLTEAQEGVLAILFKVAEDEKLELSNLEDLKALLNYIADKRKEYTTKYGTVTTQSIGVIQRSLLALESEGLGSFFGEPEFNINDFIEKDNNGYGYVNILDAVKLFSNPDLYASFLLWLLTRLFNESEEVGDLDKPKMVFFFDEAHLLFNGMPDYRLKRIVQVVKLIRSRGIGLYFISQSPSDIPKDIMNQLGNRVQHNLHAYTPEELKTVKAAAQSFRENPNIDTEKAITELKTGEALISFQTDEGEPEIVERCNVLPPESYIGTITNDERSRIIKSSSLYGKYDEVIDNHSAEEKIKEMAAQAPVEAPKGATQTVEMSDEEYERACTLARLNGRPLPERTKTVTTETKTETVKEAPKTTKKGNKKTFAEKLETKVENKIGNKIASKIVNSLFK